VKGKALVGRRGPAFEHGVDKLGRRPFDADGADRELFPLFLEKKARDLWPIGLVNGRLSRERRQACVFSHRCLADDERASERTCELKTRSVSGCSMRSIIIFDTYRERDGRRGARVSPRQSRLDRAQGTRVTHGGWAERLRRTKDKAKSFISTYRGCRRGWRSHSPEQRRRESVARFRPPG
jgi:hypothetical protein